MGASHEKHQWSYVNPMILIVEEVILYKSFRPDQAIGCEFLLENVIYFNYILVINIHEIPKIL